MMMIVVGITLGIFLTIGVTGVASDVTLEVNECRQRYLHYYVEPYVKDYFECSFMSPCGVGQDVAIHNAQAEILSCLCQDIESNDGAITNYYNNEMTRFAHELQSDDVDFICVDGTKPVGRL